MSWQLEGLDDGSFAHRLVRQGTSWLTDLANCPQDPKHHAEGDVLTHVLMVCESLRQLPEYQACSPTEKQILAWAALLHDIAKPQCVQHWPDGGISAPGHALKGSLWGRRLLWERECPFPIREEIVGIVRHHMTTFWALERDDPVRLARQISLRCRCRLLAIFSEADARGRVCQDLQSLLDRLALFRVLCQEAECWDGPASFVNSTTRYRYFEGKWHDTQTPVYEDFRCQVTLMSGLPAAGKDTWLEENCPGLPVISLDRIREQLGVAHTGPQGQVVEVARERAREFLRAGQDFVWNATNIGQRTRQTCLNLFLEYGARVRLVYLERPRSEMLRANERRTNPVPATSYEKMVQKWEVPEPTEAHQVDLVTGNATLSE